MVASEEEEVLWVLDLVGQEEADGFEGLLSSVNIISEEKVIGFRWESSVLKQSQQVIILTMDISTYFDWCFQLEKDGLVDENVSGLDAKSPNFLFSQLHLFARPASIHRLDSDLGGRSSTQHL